MMMMMTGNATKGTQSECGTCLHIAQADDGQREPYQSCQCDSGSLAVRIAISPILSMSKREDSPHIIVAVGKGEPDFVENSWVGLSVEIGETLLLVTNPCDRWVMTTMPQADLPQDHGILRTAAQHKQPFVPVPGQAMPSVGVYANVLGAGTVCRGDPIRVQQAVAAA